MWIIQCTELTTTRGDEMQRRRPQQRFLVGPFGTDDQAEDTARQLQAEHHVRTDIQPLVEPARARAGATL